MKKIYVLLVVGASFMMSACSDFLDREPLTTPNSETFLSNASAVNNYINGLYIALPSFGTTIWEFVEKRRTVIISLRRFMTNV